MLRAGAVPRRACLFGEGGAGFVVDCRSALGVLLRFEEPSVGIRGPIEDMMGCGLVGVCWIVMVEGFSPV